MFILFFLLGCAATKNKTSSPSQIPSVIIEKDFNDLLNYSPSAFAILKYSVQNDTLLLEILSKKKGNDKFVLKTNGKIMKSSPPQINLYLFLKDTLKAKETPTVKKLLFDISPLKTKQNGKLILNINDRAQKIEYFY